jgi:hypothetical protein
LCGGKHSFAAQANLQIDAEITENSRFRAETSWIKRTGPEQSLDRPKKPLTPTVILVRLHKIYPDGRQQAHGPQAWAEAVIA